jgi:hypothetical protein
MSDPKIVKLVKPFAGFNNQMITEIKFREPTFNDYMDFGDPETLVGLNAGEAGFFQEDIGVIRKYIERLGDVDPNFLPKLGLKDTLAVKAVILSFFRDATRETTPQKEASLNESHENSYSDTDSQFIPSKL